MKQILVGVDGSEESRAALRFAAHLAGVRDERLCAVRSWQYPATAALPWSSAQLPSPEEAGAAITSELREVLAEELGAPDAASIDVSRGNAAEALIGRAGNEHVTAVVTGSRGLGGFSGLLLGSVTRQLAEHTPKPVVVVRDPERRPDLSRLLVAVDGSPGSAAALRWAADLAVRAGSTVVAAHALSLPTWEYDLPTEDPGMEAAAEKLASEWAAPLADAGVEHRTVVLDGDPRLLLTDLADEVDAGLVVAGTRGHTGIAKVVLGSVATHLVHHLRRPLALVPTPR